MEVHHHAHTTSPPAGRARKKWTHYFWEFLMLFLAVFCGFLAEYKLEHTLEYQRGKQYASTMLEDLKADKEALEAGIRANKKIMIFIDTLLSIYHPDKKQTKTTARLYYYGRYGLWFWYYVNKQVTLEQMKHSGTIRYFQNPVLEKKMVRLDKEISFVKYWDGRDELFNGPAINYSSKLFNYAYLRKTPIDTGMLERHENTIAVNRDIDRARDSFLLSDPPLVSNNADLVSEFLNFCGQRIPVLKAKVSAYESALLEIEKTAKELKEEYHLK